MSNLQIWLAVIGVIAVLLILAQGIWQLRQRSAPPVNPFMRSTPSALAPQPEPVPPLPPNERKEPPGESAPQPVDPPAGDAAPLASEPAPVEAAEALLLEPQAVPLVFWPGSIDAYADEVAWISPLVSPPILALPPFADTFIAGKVLLEILRQVRWLRSDGHLAIDGFPFLVEGGSGNEGPWETPRADARYAVLRLGLQRATRRGALSQETLLAFSETVRRLADALMGTPSLPVLPTALRQATELDAYCAALDVRLRFYLSPKPQQSWPVLEVLEKTERAGFLHQQSGLMVLPLADALSQGAITLRYPLEPENQTPPADMSPTDSATDSASAATSRPSIAWMSLSFDVPQIAERFEPFERLVAAAFALARDLDCDVTDDAGTVISQSWLETIRTQLGRVYDSLRVRNWQPGSPLMRRLFS